MNFQADELLNIDIILVSISFLIHIYSLFFRLIIYKQTYLIEYMSSSNKFLKDLKTDFFNYMPYCALCTKYDITENTLRKIIKMQDWIRKKPSKILYEIVEKKIKVSDEFLKPVKKTKNIINDIKEEVKDEIKNKNKNKIIDKVVSEIKRDIINKPKRIRKKKQEEPDDDKKIKKCEVNVNDISDIKKLTTKIKKDCKK